MLKAKSLVVSRFFCTDKCQRYQYNAVRLTIIVSVHKDIRKKKQKKYIKYRFHVIYGNVMFALCFRRLLLIVDDFPENLIRTTGLDPIDPVDDCQLVLGSSPERKRVLFFSPENARR